MSAARFREAAKVLRERAEAEAIWTLHDGAYLADQAGADEALELARVAVEAARQAIERGAKAASVRASVLQGHLDALRKVLFEDAATDHDMRLRKAHAVIRQVEKMEPFENAYASLRAERDTLAARLAAVEALFAGGPDTPCRTLWRATEGLIGEWAEIECVEVPLDELRAALATEPTPADVRTDDLHHLPLAQERDRPRAALGTHPPPTEGGVMTVQIEALAVAEQLHRAARHAIFPRAKIVACTPCIEQAHALAPFITAIEREAKAEALREAADDLPSLTHGQHSEGIKGWPHRDQHIYELAIEEASVKIHDRADRIERESDG